MKRRTIHQRMKEDYGLKMKRVIDARGKARFIPEGTELIESYSGSMNHKGTQRAIVQKYSEGLSVREISQLPGYPTVNAIYHQMYRDGAFKRMMKDARDLRGVVFEEKALAAANAADEKNVQSSRLKVDTFKWAAEVNNPEVYGKKTKIIGDPDQPIAFLIDTGIRREDPPKIEKKVEDEGA